MHVDLAGGGRDQADPDHAVAEQLGVLLRQGDDRHPAHRVADEHDGPLGYDVVEHLLEVLAELVDGGVALGGSAGPAVRALVVVDGAHQSAVAGSLEVPAVEVERVAMDEHHGEPLAVRVDGTPARAAGPVGELVHLDMERYAVVGHDRDRRRPQRPEDGLVTGPAVGDDPAAAGDADGGAGHGDTDGAGGHSCELATDAHSVSSSLTCSLTCRRTIRPPIRVTIS